MEPTWRKATYQMNIHLCNLARQRGAVIDENISVIAQLDRYGLEEGYLLFADSGIFYFPA